MLTSPYKGSVTEFMQFLHNYSTWTVFKISMFRNHYICMQKCIYGYSLKIILCFHGLDF